MVKKTSARSPGSASLRGSALLLLLLFAPPTVLAAADPRPAISVRLGDDGRLAYAADDAGNRVLDFSPAGYGGGGVALPLVPARIAVAPDPAGRLDQERIQAALDLVAALPPDAAGFRGAVLLRAGRYRIAGSLQLRAGGVVLRGSGEGEDGTVLVATGHSRRTLIEVGGTGELTEAAGTRTAVADAFVPVGAATLSVADASRFAAGDRVVIRRPCTAEWIRLLGMDTFTGWRADTRLHWHPGSREITWERTVLAVDGSRLTLDAPLTTALDRTLGGGTVAQAAFPGRIARVGIENLRCVSEFDAARPLDEEHAWGAVALDRVEDAWVRRVTALHFAGHTFHAQAASSRLTIEDCTALDPVSELADWRRRAFSIDGQLTLVQRCTSERGRRDFTTGFLAAGPNVFLQCRAREATDWSGPAESWASGVLYDQVIIRGHALRLRNLGPAGQGAGWAAANSLLWNCEATDIQVQSPPGATNQAYGTRGEVTDDRLGADPALAPFRDFGRGGPTRPASLYLAQLAERLGPAAAAAIARAEPDFASADAGARPLTGAEVGAFVAAGQARRTARAVHPLQVVDAQFVIDGQPAWTQAVNWSWFQGVMPRPLARAFGPAITRFAPGETGPGLTDDLEQVAAGLAPGAVFHQHYGLWYERRRVNHNFYGAPEHRPGEVAAPFMEVPWARSGQGRDWNGLSRFDLTRFNPWYFDRVKAFAGLCARHGRILYHHFYFQHALQETRAHYVDFPWRPVNCLQDTGLPDENPAASAFYDVGHPVRRELHRLYLRHTLDVLGDEPNVVFGLDREYSGPLAFVQFVLDTVAEWQRERGRTIRFCLEVPKDQMDALLADPARAPLITAIDFHHWFYRPDGSLYTITGGINKAPREQSVGIVTAAELDALRAGNTNPTWNGANIVSSPEFQRAVQRIRAGTPALRYRAFREYRDAFPGLVIVNQRDPFPALSAAIERHFPATRRALARPAPLVRNLPASAWCLAAPGRAYLVYTMTGEAVELDLSGDSGDFTVRWLDSASGELHPTIPTLHAAAPVSLAPPVAGTGRAWVAWLERQPPGN